MGLDTEQFKQRQRLMWGPAGDYPDVAKLIQSVSEEVVEAARIEAGQDVLDVATGTGNAALIAAQRGAQVTGLDLTPELLEVARARAAEQGLEITFVEGDAEALPFDDASFDRVTSVFGTMFAPDQEQAAAELLRVCRPGGTVAVAAWTPDGLNGEMFATVGRHVPPPEGLRPPTQWGSEERMSELVAGAEPLYERRVAHEMVRAPSVPEWIDYLEHALGPIALAKKALEPDGRWAAARADLEALYERFNEADDGTLAADPPYLLTVARKPG